ncbi:hypothetical protein Tco_0993656 [Tanacetum coccineum]
MCMHTRPTSSTSDTATATGYSHSTQQQVHETSLSMPQAEIAALQETDHRRQAQMRRARQPAPDARIPDHQDASGDADSHVMFFVHLYLLKVNKYISGLPDKIYGNVKAARPKTLDETIELANDLMDQKLRTYAERQSDNKRKADDSSRNNHGTTTTL